jgi:chorismate synthase
MSFEFGRHLHITIFGQSHAKAIGVVMDGLPAGEMIDFSAVESFMSRRAPGKNVLTTERNEPDLPVILSGICNDRTCGAPVCMMIENQDPRPKDYVAIQDIPRPMHADYPAYIKSGGYNDIRGGGPYSGRMTAPLCLAGAVCLQLLANRGIKIAAHIASVADVQDQLFDPVAVDASQMDSLLSRNFPVLNEKAGEEMRERIQAAKLDQDSVGGVIEAAAIGFPAGYGDPMFDGLENRLAQVLFGIPAVKGLEFGAGFSSTKMRGSEHNDPFYFSETGEIRTRTNHHGGILGGISTGMPIILRVAFKPTPSIGKEQDSVSFSRKENVKLTIQGRHDPCVVLRAVPVVEAAIAVVLLDYLL